MSPVVKTKIPIAISAGTRSLKNCDDQLLNTHWSIVYHTALHRSRRMSGYIENPSIWKNNTILDGEIHHMSAGLVVLNAIESIAICRTINPSIFQKWNMTSFFLAIKTECPL